VDRVTVNEDGPEGSCGACVLAGSATNAYFVLYLRYEQASFKGYHMACLGGAMFRAGSACSLFSIDNAVFLNKDSLADLSQFLGFGHEWHDGSCGADVGTPGAIIVAEAAVKIHPRLHNAGKTVLVG